MSPTPKLQTTAVRSGIASDPAHGAVVPPIYLSANFTFAGFEQPRTYDYSRSGNPTRDHLTTALRDLEGGHGAVATASGMAAVALVASLLGPTDRVVLPHDCYGGTWRLFDALHRQGKCIAEFVDQRDTEALTAALAQKPKIVWAETPSNPLLRLVDVRRLALQSKAAGALLVVDNTFLSPLLQRPLILGADVVVHSTTKYIAGHSDVVGGAVIARTQELHERLSWWANAQGLTGAPFDAFLILRGLRTLGARMNVHEQNAQAVAQLLEQHPAVRRVHYPGLASHCDHALAKAQQEGFGGMLSFELADPTQVRTFVESLRCFSLAESLGGVESLVAHPASMTHASMSPAARTRAGIGPGLLRLSVGIEALSDLTADIESALAGCLHARAARRKPVARRTAD